MEADLASHSRLSRAQQSFAPSEGRVGLSGLHHGGSDKSFRGQHEQLLSRKQLIERRFLPREDGKVGASILVGGLCELGSNDRKGNALGPKRLAQLRGMKSSGKKHF